MDEVVQPQVASLEQLLKELPFDDNWENYHQERFPASRYEAVIRQREPPNENLWRFENCLDIPMHQIGTFFISENGTRMVFGKDIHAYSKKMYNPVTVTSNKSQKHVVHCKDRALADQVQIFPHNKGKHLSEYGTRISQNDHRHLLMVPTEIRLKILEFLLLAPGAITPQTMATSSEEHRLRPGYKIDGKDGYVVRKSRISRNDKHGPYIELRNIITKPIDATVLRTCKTLGAEGSKILYGKNEFTFFSTTNCFAGWRIQPTMDIKDGRLVAWCYHNDGMPSYAKLVNEIGRTDYNPVVEDLMRYTDDEIPCWVYGDRLLHWIRTIGPTNSSNVLHLGFRGDLPGHEITEFPSCTKKCYSCVQNRLRMYAQFIQRYCPHLRTLYLQVRDITSANTGQWGDVGIEPDEEKWEQVRRIEMSNYSSLKNLTIELLGAREMTRHLTYTMIPTESKSVHSKARDDETKREVYLVDAKLRRQESPGCGFTDNLELTCRV